MKHLKLTGRVLSAALLLSGLATSVFAQAKDDSQRDRMKNESSITGCLNKDAAGAFTITDEKTGAKTTVTGSADLDKHSANHKVTLTGATKTDASGKPTFEV